MDRIRSLGPESALSAWHRLRAAPVVITLAWTAMFSHFLRDGHNDQRLLQLGFIAVSTLFMLMRRPIGGQLSALAALLVTAFFALGIVSGTQAATPRVAMMEVSLFLALFVIAQAGAREMASNYDANIDAVLNIVGIGCALYVFQSLVIYLTALTSPGHPSDYAFAPGFSNQRFFNHAQTFTLPFLALLACRQQATRHRIFWLAVTAYWWTLVFVLGGKATIVAAACAAVLAAAWMGARARIFLTVFGGSAMAGLCILALLFVLVPALFGHEPFLFLRGAGGEGGFESSAARIDLWQRCLTLIGDAPWLGVGPMHYTRHVLDLGVGAHPHNWVLQIAAEWGVPALLVVCGAVGLGCRALLGRVRAVALDDTNGLATASALVVTGSALLIDGLFSGQLVMPVSQLLIALYLACVIGWMHAGKPPAPGLRPVAAWCCSLLAVAAAACLIGGAAQDISADGPPGSKMPDTGAPPLLLPRFWAVVVP